MGAAVSTNSTFASPPTMALMILVTAGCADVTSSRTLVCGFRNAGLRIVLAVVFKVQCTRARATFAHEHTRSIWP